MTRGGGQCYSEYRSHIAAHPCIQSHVHINPDKQVRALWCVVGLLLMEAAQLSAVHTLFHTFMSAGPRVLVVSLLLMESVLLRLVQDPVSQANTVGVLVDPTGKGGQGGRCS